ncbi:uncharacterized protein MKZ38_002482 [Zalerion maritima]|uniref:Calcineurin-like phosphoesterase domain-containing protein n=1 Tax=Zalerion maritima TaxID=339359 RepID=A0AAD5WQT1_9PEZI|nr:uncharacterized protein MKZ38_002482 [Zalerion maritima]
MVVLQKSFLGASLALGVAHAAQPGARSPVEAPMRDLKWGKLNFLHTTDTHGWHGGHMQEPQYSADWGDYISFTQHLKARADAEGVDLLVVDTGDRVEGNGLYDASSPQGLYTYDIFRHQPMDIICTGNHELYVAATADREYSTTVKNYPDTYLASNLDYINPETGEQVPLSPHRYRRFKTKNQGIEIVALGFLFDFTGNANNTVVQKVEDTVEEQWFLDATNVRTQPDLYVVIGHVGIRMEEYQTIFRSIRERNWYTPIAFFGGHHHVRDSATYDSRAFALASGRYFETIGFMSIDGIKAGEKDYPGLSSDSISFHRRYIDNNLFGFHYHAGLNETGFATEEGLAVSKMITEGRKKLNLDDVHGCAPKSLWMSRTPYGSEDSIYTWLEDEVLPDIIFNEERKDKPRLALMNTGAIRFDIFEGKFTRDTTCIVSPFKSGMKYLPDVPYKVASKIITLLNKGGAILESMGANNALDPKYMGIPQQLSIKEDIVYPESAKEATLFRIQGGESGQKVLGGGDGDGDGENKPALIGGYTTKDDISADGDDTVHAPLNFYTMPNCIQAEINLPAEGEPDPEMVDLVFMDFIEPWVLLAVKFAGGQFEQEDVKKYLDGSFTEGMVSWIEENWNSGDC